MQSLRANTLDDLTLLPPIATSAFQQAIPQVTVVRSKKRTYMTKLQLAFGSLVLLILNFFIVSFFSLTALSKLLSEPSELLYLVTEFKLFIIQPVISIFIDDQIYIARTILLISSLLLLAIIAWRSPSILNQQSSQQIRWLLMIANGLTQLMTLAIYVNNLDKIVPIDQIATSKLIDVLIEITTVFIVTTLLFSELMTLLLRLLKSETSICGSKKLVDPNSIRPVVFLFLFGVDLSAAFIPLHMKNIYQPLLNLPEDVVLGLPISTMFFCVSITIILSGIWVDRRGWHEPLLVGLFLTAGAMIYAWNAPTAIHFTIAMGLVGLGYGLALMAPQGFVMMHTDHSNKARGLAYLFAGLYAGSICGTATGAMLAERIGYRAIFLFSAVIIFLALIYTWVALRDAFKKQGQYERRHVAHRYNWPPLKSTPRLTRSCDNADKSSQTITAMPVTAKHYWNFLSNRYVLSLIFLSSLPSAIAVIGLLNYFVPVYLNHIGISQSIIGSVLILYGLCMVYLAPLISKYIDFSDNKRLFVVAGCILGGLSFLGFQFFTGLVATVIAVLLLGLSSCFVLASQTTYALTLDVTQQLGQGRAIGIFRASSRIGQMIGPILFGWLIITTDLQQGLVYFGSGYLVTAVLFSLATRSKPHTQEIICHERS